METFSGLQSVRKGCGARLQLQREAPLRLLVSGSVVLGNHLHTAALPQENASSGCDEWDCYRPAQMQLLHALARAPGCTVLSTPATAKPRHL